MPCSLARPHGNEGMSKPQIWSVGSQAWLIDSDNQDRVWLRVAREMSVTPASIHIGDVRRVLHGYKRRLHVPDDNGYPITVSQAAENYLAREKANYLRPSYPYLLGAIIEDKQ